MTVCSNSKSIILHRLPAQSFFEEQNHFLSSRTPIFLYPAEILQEDSSVTDMSTHKRIVHCSIVASLIIIFAILRQQANISTTEWYLGLELTNSSTSTPSHKWSGFGHWSLLHRPSESVRHTTSILTQENYTRALVIPRMKDEDISWIAQELPDLNATIYVANDPSNILHAPKNKGHEVMVYLTYIIDHYEDLPDVIIFMHAHRWAHHNSELLGYDAPQMIRRLSNRHVLRQGYVNLRCNWSPGCPEWLHPHKEGEEVLAKQEEAVLIESWDELFPSEPLPQTLAQPCCAQFALSRGRIRSLSLSRYIFFRDWILQTPLSDYVSGRIWEYSWQYLFTSQGVACPAEYLCYCDAFRLCFGGAAEFNSFTELQRTKHDCETKLRDMQKGGPDKSGDAYNDSKAEPNDYTYLHRQLEALNKELASLEKAALDRGDSLEDGSADLKGLPRSLSPYH